MTHNGCAQFLLAKELPMDCVLRLWDTYFSCAEGLGLHLYTMLAILVNFHEELIELEHSELKGFLQHLPEMDMDQVYHPLFASWSFSFKIVLLTVFLAMVRSSPRRTTSRTMHLNEDSSDSIIREAMWAPCSRAKLAGRSTSTKTALVLSDASAIGLSAVQNRLAAYDTTLCSSRLLSWKRKKMIILF